jgi:hypothetical protein
VALIKPFQKMQLVDMIPVNRGPVQHAPYRTATLFLLKSAIEAILLSFQATAEWIFSSKLSEKCRAVKRRGILDSPSKKIKNLVALE